MEPNKNIKQHDFVSNKPKHKWFLHWTAEQNPCNEILLSDWGESMLNGGFRQGELGVVMAPAGVGKTGIFQRLMETMGDNIQPMNFDYMNLYPEIQRLHHIVPEGHITTENNPNPNTRLIDHMVEMRRRRREQQEMRESMEEHNGFINKLMLNSNY